MDSFIIGAFSGILSRTCVAPFERLKVLDQRNPTSINYRAEIRRIIAEDGLLAFWRGNLTNCIRVTPSSAIQYGSFDHIQKIFPDKFVAGGMVGTVAMFCCYPLDYSRSRLTVQRGKENIKLSKFIINSVMQNGIQSVYKGIGFSLFATVPYNALSFGMYDCFTPMIEKYRKNHMTLLDHAKLSSSDSKSFNAQDKLIAGLISGWTTGVLTYPLEVIRRRMQLRGQVWNGDQMPDYKNAFDCIQKIYREFGIRGFYKGIPACMIRTPLSIAISLTSFDAMKHMIGRD